MSFKCENCNTIQESGTKTAKVVTQIRNVTYPPTLDDRGNIERVPSGSEIVKELTVCPDCANLKYHIAIVGEDKRITDAASKEKGRD